METSRDVPHLVEQRRPTPGDAPGRGVPVVGEVKELSLEPLRGGALLRRVEVADELDHTTPEAFETRAAARLLDEMLRQNPQWPTTGVQDGELVHDGNPTAQWLFSSPALTRWRAFLVPSALSLEPMQVLDSAIDGVERDEMARLMMSYSLDALGIRSRAHIMADMARLTVRGTGARWVSLACGAALPILSAARGVGRDLEMTLVDVDPRALQRARELIEQHCVQGATLLEQNLLRTLVLGDSLVQEVGEKSVDMVEALGLFEYLPDKAATKLLTNAHRMLRSGGALVVGNMLSDRRELDFNQRCLGWPGLHVRSVEDMLDLVERAGLPLTRCTVTIPQDGIYAVLSVTR